MPVIGMGSQGGHYKFDMIQLARVAIRIIMNISVPVGTISNSYASDVL